MNEQDITDLLNIITKLIEVCSHIATTTNCQNHVQRDLALLQRMASTMTANLEARKDLP